VPQPLGKTDTVPEPVRIALVAHKHKKPKLLEWARFNCTTLAEHELIATGTAGAMLAHELGLTVKRLNSGPLGGDLQIGAKIADGELDALLFLPSQLLAWRASVVPLKSGQAR
jgi:methylglyoxal synthase